jgi:hypothetical protein
MSYKEQLKDFIENLTDEEAENLLYELSKCRKNPISID